MRPARNRRVYEAEGVRFERPSAPVLQIIESPTIAAWNAAAEEGSLDLGGHLAARRGDDHKSSFHYDVVATTPAGQVYFLVGDHKASDVLIFWEYSTSTPDARRMVEQAFWALLAATPPSDYEDVFSFDEASGVRYGYRAGRPWVTALPWLPPARKLAGAAQP